MAYLGGGFTSAVAAAGNAILSGKELQQRDDEIQLQKQQVAMGQLALQNAQRQQQTQATVGAFLSSEAQKDASSFTDPAKSAQLYEKAAGLALQGGDFVSANEMGELAKGKMAEAKEQLVVQAQQQHQKLENFASAADDYAANPTADGYKAMAQAAVAAGRNPSEIPMPGTPQMRTYLNNASKAAMDSKSRAELAEKANEFTQRQAQQKEEHADNVALRQANMQQNAMLREAMIGIRQQELKDREADRAAKAAAGPKQTSQQIQANNAIIASGSEAVRGLHVIGALDSDQTAGPFQGMSSGTIVESLAKTGGNILTSQDQQIYHTATAGLGLELARTMTLGGGRGANQATINELQDVVTAHPGDTKATAVFKFANAADIIRNRLESMPTPQDKEQADKRQKLLDDLSKVPTPNAIIAAVKDPKQRAKMLATQDSMADAIGKIDNGTQLPGSPDAGAGTTAPPLPSGWSVKEH